MMYSRKFSAGNEKGMIPPDYSGVAYRTEAARQSEEERGCARRPRRALYKEDYASEQEKNLRRSYKERHYSFPSENPIKAPSYQPFGERYTRESQDPREWESKNSRESQEIPAREGHEEIWKAEANDSPAGGREEREEKKERREDREERQNEREKEKKCGFFPGLSRLTKHSFTMEDILLIGLILLLLNGDSDSDLLLILGFLLLTGL